MLDLKSLEGTKITAIIPLFNAKAQEYTLHQVEPYGLWVESQEQTERILEILKTPVTDRTFVAFVPWHGITCVYGSVDKSSLSEKAFGLQR